MYKFIVFIVILFMIFLAPFLLFCIITNLHRIAYYLPIDLIKYILHKDYNRVKTGVIIALVGLFGQGKTLSAVHMIVKIYRKKNGKKVWCKRRKKFVRQRIHVISNVDLCIPYERFESLEQIVLATDRVRAYDDEHDTLTVTLVLGDEFSVQMNSRKFKENIDPLLLNTILTCRHWNISIYYTAQRFAHVDALLRQVTSYVLECKKFWRFQEMVKYDAWDLENSTNTQLVKAKARLWWFVRNKDYTAYDTFACVGNLKKSMQEGDMMSEEEILALQTQSSDANMDGVNYNRRYKRRSKRLHK